MKRLRLLFVKVDEKVDDTVAKLGVVYAELAIMYSIGLPRYNHFFPYNTLASTERRIRCYRLCADGEGNRDFTACHTVGRPASLNCSKNYSSSSREAFPFPSPRNAQPQGGDMP